ncbi:MAG: aminopeptidase P family protein [Candidatus Magnetomorum sp.]|nr:aminopeptidase P family protein [Candidatus Magnetomorum sp.]
MQNLSHNYQHRIDQIQKRLKEKSFDSFMICTAENRQYLTGFSADDGQIDEISGILFITENKILLATDSRYSAQAKRETHDIEIFCFNNTLEKIIPKILKKLGVRSLGFESNRLPVALYEKLQRSIMDQNLMVRMVPVTTFVEDLRTSKEDAEIKAIQIALEIAETSFLKVVQNIKPSMTEKEVAWCLESEMRQSGADSIAFPVIVASGPNAALPHATPTDRPIRENDPVLFDWGARHNGYRSDTSRTLVLGQPEYEFIQAFQALADTQKMAIDEIAAGKKSKDIAQKAHKFLEKKGYGKVKFAHGLGHGVGLATHESPTLSLLKETTLEEGSVVTVEPGIYIPDRWGIRLENMVVVKDGSAQVLNKLPIHYHF